MGPREGEVGGVIAVQVLAPHNHHVRGVHDLLRVNGQKKCGTSDIKKLFALVKMITKMQKLLSSKRAFALIETSPSELHKINGK